MSSELAAGSQDALISHSARFDTNIMKEMIKNCVPESVNVADLQHGFLSEATYCRVYPKILWFYDWSLALEDFWHFQKALRIE